MFDQATGAHDEIVGLGESLLRQRRIDAHGVIFGADAAHEAGDETAACEVIEHGVFLGNHQRIVEERQRAAEYRELCPLDAARECTGEDAGDRHHAVGGLVMLVEADPVEAKGVGELHLVEIFVIEPGAFFGIIETVRQRHPGGAVAVDGIEIHVPVGHQMKIEELHAAKPRAVDSRMG